jgi:hypothetical protein
VKKISSGLALMQDAIVSLAIFKAFLGTLENEYG